MKFFKILFITFLLCVFTGIAVSAVLYFFVWKQKDLEKVSISKDETAIREPVRSFTFSQKDSLKSWEEKALSSKNTSYNIESENGEGFVKAVSEDSASAIFFKEKLSYKKNPYVSWSWKAEKFPEWRRGESLEKKDEFDFVAQVYVIFYARFFLKTKAIQYVWTETIPEGTVVSSPYTDNVKVVVLESGNLGEWKNEDRDIREDFTNFFGQELEKDVVAVAFMTDSDSTDSRAVAFYDNFTIGYIQKDTLEGNDLQVEKTLEPGNFAKN